MKRKLLLTALVVFVTAFTGLAIVGAIRNKQEIHSKNIQLESKTFKLQKIETEFKKLNQDLQAEKHKDTIDQKKIDELERKVKEQEDAYKALEVSKANQKAERDRIAQAQSSLANAVTPKASASPRMAVTGNKEAWLRASGIPESDWWAVDSIVSRESGWQPCAYNPGRNDCNANPTSACGLAQSLPCGKQAKFGHWTDPVANLKWQYEYVTARYGGYPQAVAFWNSNHWY